MELPKIKILDEKNKILHQKSVEVKFPLSAKEKQDSNNMLLYLKMSQIDEEREKYDLRAGMGLAYVQIGVLKRIFVIVDEYEEGQFKNYVVINPEIKSMSEELVYVGEGEGCLSINRDVEGIVPRHARITVDAYDEDGNPVDATATRFLEFGKCLIYPNSSAKLVSLNDGQRYAYSYEVIAPLSKHKYKILPREGDKVMIIKKDGTINKVMEVKGFTTYKRRYLKLWL